MKHDAAGVVPVNLADVSEGAVAGAEMSQTGDMPAEEFLQAAGRAADWIAGYLQHPGRFAVLPVISPGDLTRALPAQPPREGEPVERLLDDFERLIVPATTHWNHPGFFGYFATTGSAAGILGEFLSAALNVNAMLWRTGPAATELEQVTVDWLRQLVGLPDGFEGTINDTASTSTLHALAAAREAQTDLRIRELGMAGRPELPGLRVYCSEDAHSSVDKAMLTLGLGLDGLRRVPTDADYRMDAGALSRMVTEDRAAGLRPVAVVATVGTTTTTAIDPVPAIADVCEREGIWLHVDAAYGGAAALMPEFRHVLDGCGRADSLVVNPHKWLFVPVDCSVLYCRGGHRLRRAFSVTPDYLTTPDPGNVLNLMDHGVALGRRFRALKLWFVLRYFGAAGLRERLREHVRLARLFASWVDGDDRFERLAPVPFSVVVFRHLGMGGAGEDLDRLNAELLDRVNGSGEVFLSHARVRGRFGLRLAVGNARTTEAHVRRVWELVGGG